MAKKKKSSRKSSKRAATAADVAGKHLVIVESPAKAKTINRYLGDDYHVEASVGHVRDLPAKAPKGSKQDVPGVDIERNFEPTYEVLPGKKKVMSHLKSLAKKAADVWFATDLDREGEAIAWHVADELGISADEAKRVVFNAITKDEIERAFNDPHNIDQDRVNAQQARRVLDRIVGYKVSPLLWKKVARGLSAGRVQSVAVRLIVEREREIQNFVPDEYWKVIGHFALDENQAPDLARQWQQFVAQTDEKGKGPTQKDRNAWLAEHYAIKAELVEVDGEKFELGCSKDKPLDLSDEIRNVAQAVGLQRVDVETQDDDDGKGPARYPKIVHADIAPNARYAVQSIETKRTRSNPQPPFITSTMQMAASNALSLSSSRTMRLAQDLYEGVNVKGEGQVGLITYMRTDSTHLSDDALKQARGHIKDTFGDNYLPDKSNTYTTKSQHAQEAHEAIRPTDVSRTPQSLQGKIDDAHLKLYRLIWNRFVACQMTPAQWDSTTALLRRSDQDTGAVFKATGRVLVFDGYYRVAGVPTATDEQKLPELSERQQLTPFDIDPQQLFTSPPPRYTEASLVKTLEAEGIGRPSTYAQIIQVIQDRGYVEQINRRFFATDLGEVVTDKLLEAFPNLMDIGYTREMEDELDEVAERKIEWHQMLNQFYKDFQQALDEAHETLEHAKAETQPAIYQCPKCGARTCYRFGKNGRFLSCTQYPDCDYAAPIDREGVPQLPEKVNVACPEDGSPMVLRSGRFGKFLASVNYPDVKTVVNLDKKGQIKYPSPEPLETDLPCPTCESPLYLRRGKRGPWLGCSTFPKCKGRGKWSELDDETKERLEKALEEHERQHPQPVVHDLQGNVIPEGTPIEALLIPGGAAELEIHPEAKAELEAAEQDKPARPPKPSQTEAA